MTKQRRDSVSDDEARALWRRATELQEAAEREGAPDALPAPLEAKGLPLDQVVKVAEEVGIERDHVLLALAERRLADAHELNRSRPRSRWTRMLLEEPDGVEVSKLVGAAPERVVSALAKATDRDTFAPAAAGALAGGALGVWVFRRLQRWGYGEGRTALGRLARAVAVEAEGDPLGS